MVRKLLLVLVAFFVLVPSANAAEIAWASDSRQKYVDWLEPRDIPMPDRLFTIYEQDCPKPESFTCTYLSDGRVYMYPALNQTREIFLHELGHHFDWLHLIDEDRRSFLEIAKPGWGPNRLDDEIELWWYGGTPDDVSPLEELATAYRKCVVDADRDAPTRTINYESFLVNGAEHTAICDVFELTAHDSPLKKKKGKK